MLNDLTNYLSVLDPTPDLFREWVLGVIILTWQVDVDARTLACENLCILTVFAQINGCPIDLVEEYGRQSANDLQSEVRALDDVDGGDE